MKIVIGIQTCNRLEMTKKAIDSLLGYNPGVENIPWIIADDCSIDGTEEYLQSMSFIDRIVQYTKQSGITNCMKLLIDTSVDYGDIILYLQNDWETIRKIDFKSIAYFYELHKNTGHIRTILYKGQGTERPASKVNLATREPIKTGIPILIEKEKLIPGNWHYSDIPGFTRLDLAKKMFENMRYDSDAEGVRTINIHNMKCDNYLLDNQPFRNIDFTGSSRTPGRIY